jgi:hypothetical protein
MIWMENFDGNSKTRNGEPIQPLRYFWKKRKAISELECRGLIETRLFDGERGRGGRILKARTVVENEIVKKQISQKATLWVNPQTHR